MIKLNEKYSIKFDRMNVMLCKKVGKKDKAIAYFGSFEHLVKQLLDDQLFHEKFESLEEIKNEIVRFREEILNKIVEMKPDKKPYKYELESDEE